MTAFFDRLKQDLRYGIHMLWSKPGFTAVSVLSIASGVGATTAIFSVVICGVDRFHIKRRTALDSLFWLAKKNPRWGPEYTLAQFEDLKSRVPSMEDMTAIEASETGPVGVISYSMTQRRRELGVRIALGARPGNVLALVLRNALAMLAIGLIGGLIGVYALTRVLTNLLFEVSPLDPLALGVACFSMTAIGLFAGFLPALRAARFDPMVSLRDAG